MKAARAAYEAYRAAAFSDAGLPEFEALSDAMREAWVAAAGAARATSETVVDSDGRTTLMLRTPIVVGSETIKELRIRKPKAKDFRAVPVEGQTVGDTLNVMGKLAGQAPSVMDELEGEDFVEVASLFGDFMGGGQPTGRTR